MNFVAFQSTFKKFPLISVSDILKHDPGFDTRRLVEWQKKGYIEKIKNGFYCFTDQQKENCFSFWLPAKYTNPPMFRLKALYHIMD